MKQKKKQLEKFEKLTLDDLEDWVGPEIAARGKSYQARGAVSELAATADGGLIAWVSGSERYATKVDIDDDFDDMLDSICSCRHQFDCKHGVAIVIEFLKRENKEKPLPVTKPDDERFALLDEVDYEDELQEFVKYEAEIESYLSGKTKAQLIELVKELASKKPDVARDLIDQKQLKGGNPKELVKRLRRDIEDLCEEPDWQDPWRDNDFMPDFSEIKGKLESLLKAGYADDVLALGKDLLESGINLVEQCDDEGETEMDVANCMSVIVEALDKSSLDDVDKLEWALDAVLEDPYELCEAFDEYLDRQFPESIWSTFADSLLLRLYNMKILTSKDNYSQLFARNELSDWIIHALERSGREAEIIPLCEVEARKTFNYERVVDRLIAAGRYLEAQTWIKEGINSIKEGMSGTTSSLRQKMLEILTLQKNWQAVAALIVDEFVRFPSLKTFEDCQLICSKIKVWSVVRESLLVYLEKGRLPWMQKEWPLPETGFDKPEANRRTEYPMIHNLIKIAIMEKKPDQVLRWFDELIKIPFFDDGSFLDEIAEAIQTHSPDRAIEIWKKIAEDLINQVKPRAYQDAVIYLRKVSEVLALQNKQ